MTIFSRARETSLLSFLYVIPYHLSSVSKMVKIAKKTRKLVFENIFISIGIKVAVLILTVLGLVGIEFAIFADVGVCVIAILNAMRALYIK